MLPLFVSRVDAVRSLRRVLNELGREEFECRYGPITQATFDTWDRIAPIGKEKNNATPDTE